MVLSSRPGRTAAGAAVLLAASLLVPRAGALPPPGAEALASLQSACDSSDVVRVTTANNRYELFRPALDATGLRFSREHGRPAVITLGSVTHEEKHIPWSDVTRLEAGERHFGASLLAGTLAGAALGAGLVGIYGPDLAEPNDGALYLLAGTLTVLGSTAGALHGISSPHYRVLLTQDPLRR